jgi:hypothetical protein
VNGWLVIELDPPIGRNPRACVQSQLGNAVHAARVGRHDLDDEAHNVRIENSGLVQQGGFAISRQNVRYEHAAVRYSHPDGFDDEESLRGGCAQCLEQCCTRVLVAGRPRRIQQQRSFEQFVALVVPGQAEQVRFGPWPHMRDSGHRFQNLFPRRPFLLL